MKEKQEISSVIPMRIAKTGYVILSLVLCLMGLVLIVNRDISVRQLGLVCGAVFLAFGVVKLVGYFSRDLFRLAFQYDLEFGILMAVMGLLTLLHPGSMTGMACAALGILVLADALFKIRITLDARKFGIAAWWAVMLIAVAAAVFGAVLLFASGKGLRVILGITFITEGLMSMSTAIAMVKIVCHQIKD